MHVNYGNLGRVVVIIKNPKTKKKKQFLSRKFHQFAYNLKAAEVEC